MSFNILHGSSGNGPYDWSSRRQAVLEVIRSFDADVMGLQEVLDWQLDELLSEFPNLRAVGVGRDDGARAGEFSPILYDHRKLSIGTTDTFWFSETRDVPGSRHPTCDLPRICTWAQFDSFLFANLHLDHLSVEARNDSVASLSAWFADESQPVIITGDFNAGESDECIEAMREWGMTDTFRALHPHADGQTFHAFGSLPTHDKIDYVWTSSQWGVSEARIIRDRPNGVWPSDHYPVTATVSF